MALNDLRYLINLLLKRFQAECIVLFEIIDMENCRDEIVLNLFVSNDGRRCLQFCRMNKFSVPSDFRSLKNASKKIMSISNRETNKFSSNRIICAVVVDCLVRQIWLTFT